MATVFQPRVLRATFGETAGALVAVSESAVIIVLVAVRAVIVAERPDFDLGGAICGRQNFPVSSQFQAIFDGPNGNFHGEIARPTNSTKRVQTGDANPPW